MSKILTKILRQPGYQYMKLLMLNFLKKGFFFHKLFKTYVKNPNRPRFLPSGAKTVLKIMAMEQVLYAQVVIIRRKYLGNKK